MPDSIEASPVGIGQTDYLPPALIGESLPLDHSALTISDSSLQEPMHWDVEGLQSLHDRGLLDVQYFSTVDIQSLDGHPLEGYAWQPNAPDVYQMRAQYNDLPADQRVAMAAPLAAVVLGTQKRIDEASRKVEDRITNRTVARFVGGSIRAMGTAAPLLAVAACLGRSLGPPTSAPPVETPFPTITPFPSEVPTLVPAIERGFEPNFEDAAFVVPGAPPAITNPESWVRVLNNQALQDNLLENGYRPLIVPGVVSNTIAFENTAEAGATTVAVPRPEHLFHPDFGLPNDAEVILSEDNSVVTYGNAGPDRLPGTADDTELSQMITVIGAKGLDESATVVGAVATDKNQEFKPGTVVALAVNQNTGVILGEPMPLIFSADDDVEVAWEAGIGPVTTVNGEDLLFDFSTPPTEIPSATLAPTEVILPTATLIPTETIQSTAISTEALGTIDAETQARAADFFANPEEYNKIDEPQFFTDHDGNQIGIDFITIYTSDLKLLVNTYGTTTPILLGVYENGFSVNAILGALDVNGNPFVWVGALGLTNKEAYPHLAQNGLKELFRGDHLKINADGNLYNISAADFPAYLRPHVGEPIIVDAVLVSINRAAVNSDGSLGRLTAEELAVYETMTNAELVSPLFDTYQKGNGIAPYIFPNASELSALATLRTVPFLQTIQIGSR